MLLNLMLYLPRDGFWISRIFLSLFTPISRSRILALARPQLAHCDNRFRGSGRDLVLAPTPHKAGPILADFRNRQKVWRIFQPFAGPGVLFTPISRSRILALARPQLAHFDGRFWGSGRDLAIGP